MASNASLVITRSINVTEDVFTLGFNIEGDLLALGLGNGCVAVHDTASGALLQTVQPLTPTGANAIPLPVTALRWRPPIVANPNAARNVLLAGGGDGSLRHIHAPSGRALHTIMEANNQVLACDFRGDGGAFASAGKDKAVRVYDEETRALAVTLTSGAGSTSAYSSLVAQSQRDFLLPPSGRAAAAASSATSAASSLAALPAVGHSNRVFSVIFHPSSRGGTGEEDGGIGMGGDVNILASGGWDNTVQVWDVRAGGAVRSFYGPHIAGDGLAFSADGKYLISASWRSSHQLQFWDWASGTLAYSIPWAETNEALIALSVAESVEGGGSDSTAYKPVTTQLYSVAMSTGSGGWDGSYVLAGGSGKNEAKIFSVSGIAAAAAAYPASPAALAAAAAAAMNSGVGSSSSGTKTRGSAAEAQKYPNLKEHHVAVAAAAAASALTPHALFGGPGGLNVPMVPVTAPPQPLVATVKGLAHGVYALSWAPGGVFAVGGGTSPVGIYQLCLPGGASGWPPAPSGASNSAPSTPVPTTPSGVAVSRWNGDSLTFDTGIRVNIGGGDPMPLHVALAQVPSAAVAAAVAESTATKVAGSSEGAGEGAAAEAGGGGAEGAEGPTSPLPKATLHGSSALRAVAAASAAGANA